MTGRSHGHHGDLPLGRAGLALVVVLMATAGMVTVFAFGGTPRGAAATAVGGFAVVMAFLILPLCVRLIHVAADRRRIRIQEARERTPEDERAHLHL